MATIVKTLSGTWKAVIRKSGWPTDIKTFRLKRDAEDWARDTEVEMVRGVYIRRAAADRMTLEYALDRYLREVTPTKEASTQEAEIRRAGTLKKYLGKYSMAALTPDVVAKFRDERLEGKDRKNKNGDPTPRANDTVRLELALLGHIFTIAVREWKLGLIYNPVLSIRRPQPHPGRDRRLAPEEESKLFSLIRQHGNPMLAWIAEIALETSMREGEVVKLRIFQVDLRRRIVSLTKTKNKNSRTVPLTKRARELFVRALNHPTRPPDTDLIFFGEPGKDGKRRPYQFLSIWRNIKISAGVPDIRFHDLRHESISRLVEAGFTDQEVASISGHKSMQMVKRYTHLRSEKLVKRLDDIPQRKRSER